MSVCNMDCFNCTYPDCINDSPYTNSERSTSNSIDLDVRNGDTVPKSTKYYRNNKEKCRQYANEYVDRNREEVYKRNKEYRDSHKEEIKERNQRYYLENKDLILAKANSNYVPHPVVVKDTKEAENHRKSSNKYYSLHKEEINRKRREKRRKEKEKCKLQ